MGWVSQMYSCINVIIKDIPLHGLTDQNVRLVAGRRLEEITSQHRFVHLASRWYSLNDAYMTT